jgi:CheY-like chemotaxis protein
LQKRLQTSGFTGCCLTVFPDNLFLCKEGAFEVILIDDSQEDTELALYELKKYNFGNKLSSFRTAAEALAYLEQSPEAERLILLDLNMPKMGGGWNLS